MAKSIHYGTEQAFQELCVIMLGRGACAVIEGTECAHCDKLPMTKLCSCLAFFLRDEGQVSALCGSGPTEAEAWQRLKSWGSQVELAEEFEKGMALSCFLSHLLERSVGSRRAVSSIL